MTAALPPPPPASPAPGPPPGGSSSNGPGWVLVLIGGLVVTGALLAAVLLLWPSGDDDDGEREASSATTVLTPLPTTTRDPDALGEPSATDGPVIPVPSVTTPVDLFSSGAQDTYAALVRGSGATDVLQVLVYSDYAFLAYRDPKHPANIDERQWRKGTVSAATPNVGDDRYDPDTAAKLFLARNLDLTKLPRLVDDAARRFTMPVEVTHVIIDRFLPFDQRVLIRVYASPADGRSGGGYVEYTVDGAYVKTVA